MSKMVQKEYWKSIMKLDRYQKLQALQEKNMKNQQKRLESFVNKQLKLSSKMADFLQEPSHDEKSATEREEEDSEISEEDQSNREWISNIKILINCLGQIIIHLRKGKHGYIYENHTFEEVSLEGIDSLIPDSINMN